MHTARLSPRYARGPADRIRLLFGRRPVKDRASVLACSRRRPVMELRRERDGAGAVMLRPTERPLRMAENVLRLVCEGAAHASPGRSYLTPHLAAPYYVRGCQGESAGGLILTWPVEYCVSEPTCEQRVGAPRGGGNGG